MITKKGIDVSVWQGAIDWPKVKADGIEFAMIRLGYGSSTGDNCKIDKYFMSNVEGALAAGVEVGVYFYSYALTAAAAAKEAAFVIAALAPYKGRVLYPVAYDLEDSSQRNLGKTVLTAMVTAFCATVENAGYYASFYSNLDWCRNRLDMEALKVYDLWLAQWASAASTAYAHGMWQYTSSGSVAGISGRVDMDTAYKDYAAIIKRAGLNGYTGSDETDDGQEDTPETTGANTRERIVKIAIGELGRAEPTGDDKYIQWYNSNVLKTWSLALDSAWCAMFVTWCCAMAGVGVDVVKPYCGCTVGMGWFKTQGVWHDAAAYGGKYTPKAGDLVFYSKTNDKANSSHTGIVERVEGSTLHTIEGNTSDAVKRRSYALGDKYIIGYASPRYNDDTLAPEQLETPQEGTGSTGGGTYTVRSGDNLSKIAAAHGVTLAALIAANPQIKNPNLIHVGDVVTIPGGAEKITKTYTVQKGDSMSKIASNFGVKLAALIAANPQVKNPSLIYAGNVINIPA